MHIRSFDFQRDITVVRDLWKNAGPGVQLSPSDEPEEIRRKQARDPDLFLVAEGENGEIIGSVLGGYDGRRGLVYHLAVASAYRRQGIGDALMVELEARLRDKGCYKSYLLVAPDNQQAMDFYSHRGWETMEHRIMGKVLR